MEQEAAGFSQTNHLSIGRLHDINCSLAPFPRRVEVNVYLQAPPPPHIRITWIVVCTTRLKKISGFVLISCISLYSLASWGFRGSFLGIFLKGSH